MTQEKKSSAKLSLNVRKMKFMQRCLDADARRELEESEKKIVTSEHWELDIPTLGVHESKFEMLDSFSECQPHRYGRMSFGGFNKAIEKLMEEMNSGRQTDKDGGASDGSISDEEMTERYTSLVGTIGSKFKGNSRQNSRKGRKLNNDNDGNGENVPHKVRRKTPKLDKKGFMKPVE